MLNVALMLCFLFEINNEVIQLAFWCLPHAGIFVRLSIWKLI